MSIEAFKWAKTWQVGSAPAKAVLLMIADHYNDADRRAWPSIQTLARETETSESTVRRAVRRLEQLGLIEVESWYRHNDRGTVDQMSNRYYLPMYDAKSCKGEEARVVFAEFDHQGKWTVEEVA